MTEFNISEISVEIITGLELFLYGMNVMGDGLQKSADDRMKSIIEALIPNRIMAVFIGMVVTAIIQSSSATTGITVDLVQRISDNPARQIAWANTSSKFKRYINTKKESTNGGSDIERVGDHAMNIAELQIKTTS